MNRETLHPHLERLRALPFLTEVEILEDAPVGHPGEPDALLLLHTEDGKAHRACVKYVGRLPTYAKLDQVAANADRAPGFPWLLFAPQITTEQGAHLQKANVGYVDVAGNCFVKLAPGYLALIEGKKAEKTRRPKERAIRAAGFKVMFAILAKPELLNATVRELAEAAGAGKTAAAQLLRQLADEHTLAKAGKHWRLLDRDGLLERWLAGHAATLRPTLLIGRYQLADARPTEIEARIERELTDIRWAWGGGAAARRIDGYYRGEETVLHVERPFDVTKRLRALKDPGGKLIVLEAPGPAAFEGVKEHTIHPLLAYAELLLGDDPRLREAAARIRERFLA